MSLHPAGLHKRQPCKAPNHVCQLLAARLRELAHRLPCQHSQRRPRRISQGAKPPRQVGRVQWRAFRAPVQDGRCSGVRNRASTELRPSECPGQVRGALGPELGGRSAASPRERLHQGDAQGGCCGRISGTDCWELWVELMDDAQNTLAGDVKQWQVSQLACSEGPRHHCQALRIKVCCHSNCLIGQAFQGCQIEKHRAGRRPSPVRSFLRPEEVLSRLDLVCRGFDGQLAAETQSPEGPQCVAQLLRVGLGHDKTRPGT